MQTLAGVRPSSAVGLCPFCGTGKLELYLGGPWDKQIHCSKCDKVWVHLSDEEMESIVAAWIKRRSEAQGVT